ncbi:MAG: hypothetical protein RLZ12_496, partial [Bacillota bacterium]
QQKLTSLSLELEDTKRKLSQRPIKVIPLPVPTIPLCYPSFYSVANTPPLIKPEARRSNSEESLAPSEWPSPPGDSGK